MGPVSLPVRPLLGLKVSCIVLVVIALLTLLIEELKRRETLLEYIPHYRCGTYRHRGFIPNPTGCKSNFVKANVLERLVEQYLSATQQRQQWDSIANTEQEQQIKVEAVPVSFGPTGKESEKRLLHEREQLKQENKRLWDNACSIGGSALELAKEDMPANDNKIKVIDAALEELANRITPEQWEKRKETALLAIKEGTYRAKKEALSKVLERIDCYFEHDMNAKGSMPQYHLAKVKFFPVPLVYSDTDTKEALAAKNKIQAGWESMEKMGVVKVETYTPYVVNCSKPVLTKEGDDYFNGLWAHKHERWPLSPTLALNLAFNRAKSG